MGCLEHRIAVDGKIPVALIVGENENDVRTLPCEIGESREGEKAREETE
jgi:hypothetical protein